MATAVKAAARRAKANGSRRRRSAQETRQLLLDAGTELVLEALTATTVSEGGPLAHIRVQDVVRQASTTQGSPVTTGALYNIWPSQGAFQIDLMFYILREGANPASGSILRLAADLFSQRLPFEVIGARLSDESFRIDLESRICRAAAAFVALSEVPEVRDAWRTAHQTLLETATPLYTQLLNYGGLRVRKPYTLDQLITVIGGLIDGLEAKYSIVPEQFDVPAGERSLVASAAFGVFRQFCVASDS